ncbi:uncharacterized protein [Clytia hemisphaerica]|uniref:uncharacterized protein n=1 Tax=Clytia hemisphaerica TaxID=252671 RepID=UPI0034D4DE9A
MLYGKEKTSIKINDITITKAVKISVIHYALLALVITCIIFRAQQSNKKTDSQQLQNFFFSLQNDTESQQEIKFDNCAYFVDVPATVLPWQPFEINIRYKKSPKMECTFDDQDGGSVFRVQLYSIYEMSSQTIVYKGNGTYYVNITLTIPTKYIAMVFVTYVHHQGEETRRHVNPLLRQLRGSPFELLVLNRNQSSPPLGYSKYCSRNESGVVAGRWVKCGAIFPKVEQCGPWQSAEFDFDKINGFHWLPYTCQYHSFTNDEMKKCFAKNGWDSIVFAGDSHMRYRAYHWASRLYGGCTSCVKTHIQMIFEKTPRIEWIFDARGTRLPLSFHNISLPFEKYIHQKVRRSKFSKPFSQTALKSQLFLLNFGHWVLRESLDREFMEKKLHAYGRAAQKLIAQKKVVIWVNTVSLPWRMDRAVKNWRENTSPYRVRHFNQIADRILSGYGIPIVDAYSVSDSRIGATHDQTHFTKRMPGNEYGGVVENAISNIIFNKLCNK